MASLSPPAIVYSPPYGYNGGAVVIAPPPRRRYRHGWHGIRSQQPPQQWQGEYEQTQAQQSDAVAAAAPIDFEDLEDDVDQYGGYDFDDVNNYVAPNEEMQQFAAPVVVAAPMATAAAAAVDNMVPPKFSTFEKLHCDACSGFTLLKDGEPHRREHLEGCAVLAAGCDHKKACDNNTTRVVHLHAYPKALPPAVCENEDEEEEQSDEGSCSSDEGEAAAPPPPDVCVPKKATCLNNLVEITIEDVDALAAKMREAHANDKPISASFDRKVLTKDGKSQMAMNIAVKTSKRNAKGKSAVHVALTPIKYDAVSGAKQLVAESRIEAPMWHLEHGAGAKVRNANFLKQGAQTFRDKGVHEVASVAAIGLVMKAIEKLQ